MDLAVRNEEAAPAARDLKIYLLWRHALQEALFLSKLKDEKGPVVLVQLVNQTVDSEKLQAACREHGFHLVTLPVAFAGLHERDQVLRDAVLQRLRSA
jgi:hypothetical protein